MLCYNADSEFKYSEMNIEKLKTGREIAALFDLDGVIINTEPQYDIFWAKTGEKYQLGYDHFERMVKGMTLPEILKRYFSHLPEEECQQIAEENHNFDLQLDMIPFPGVIDFLEELKSHNIKTGLVTSSDDAKLEVVFRKLPIRPYFDTVVSADRITRGKPDPVCYLLAAEDLKVSPEKCIVFEDSFNGIHAGNRAGMKVIGLSTSNPEEAISGLVKRVIPDFLSLKVENLENL